ncbi:MAG: septal ring lytic transglycosylase RlpA family protein [Rhizobiales bacterium]|nr:septal ring lytic transglycosylase RlpA family protein [Hyphomicrobiales bacterium]MBI3672179.1 septal ring lytic transglycosylase RlpA family protein [Hyphomicrobiales bacterium]
MRKLSWVPILLVATGLTLSGCASSDRHASLNPFAGKGSPYYKGKGPIPMGGGKYLVGDSYQVAGRWFTPKEQPNYDKTGTASWYGEAFHRRMTSNGEWFDMGQLTAAHATLPLPSYVKVTNLENGREVVVRVNDRGPFVGTRVIDLSKRAADVLGYRANGTAKVRVRYIGPAPLDDNGSHLMAMNQELKRGTPMRRMIAAADASRGAVQVATTKPSQTTVVEETPQLAAYEPPKPTAPQPQSGIEESYYVQIGSYANPANAEKARAELASTWPVQVIEVAGSGGTLYRVRLGPISDRRDADTALEEAVFLGHADARVLVAHAMQAAL